MGEVIYLNEVRARRAGKGSKPTLRRARAGQTTGGKPTSIGELAEQLLMSLREIE